MDLTSALTATGILVGVAVICLVLWDVLLSPVVTFALKLAVYTAIGAAAVLAATVIL